MMRKEGEGNVMEEEIGALINMYKSVTLKLLIFYAD